MPDAAGNIKGISLSGKAGAILDKIKRQEMLDEISRLGQEQKCSCDYDGVRLCGSLPPERCQQQGSL